MSTSPSPLELTQRLRLQNSKYPPAKPGALTVSRSKRPDLTATRSLAPPEGGSPTPTATCRVADPLTPAAGCILGSRVHPDRRSTRSTRAPKVLPGEIATPVRKLPGDLDRALPLDIPGHLRHRVFRGNRHQHVHVIRQQVSLLHLTLAVPGQLPEHVAPVRPELPIDRLFPILRDEYHVILAMPFRMIETSGVRH